MKSLLILLSISIIAVCAYGKRMAPEEIDEMNYNNQLIIRVPHFKTDAPGMKHNGGYVEVIDKKTNKRVCLKEIYSATSEDSTLESDVQDVFISSAYLRGGILIMKDEKSRKYKKPVIYLCD